MKAGNGGGCVTVSECNAFITKADTTGGTCPCLNDNDFFSHASYTGSWATQAPSASR